MKKPLSAVLAGIEGTRVTGSIDVEISNIVFNSSAVKPGDLFVALEGTRVDGHQFLGDAVSKGAAAVVIQKPIPVPGVTTVQVPDTLAALSFLSQRFWENPSSKLSMVGLTGTNGKTTTSYVVESILEKAGLPTAVLGTINYRFRDTVLTATNTTPFASDLQRFLSDSLHAGAKAAVMEVSSHALSLHRVDGIEYEIAVFTNLTQDHLDFHKTMEAYASAKRRLFERVKSHAVLNADDRWFPYFKEACSVPVLTYGLKQPADIRVDHLECRASGSTFELITPKGSMTVRLPLVGDYNIANALAATGVGLSKGIDLKTIVKGLESVPQVPGRMERVDAGQSFSVIVDYAHTEDALRKAMGALRKLQPNRLLTVFGCGGDRDRSKRPLMGQAAAEMSDLIWITSDNPRTEDPEKIALDIEVGVRRNNNDRYRIFIDRKAAIADALKTAEAGDVVLIAGKGHETYQIVGRETIPFDDRKVARDFLAR